MNALYEIELQAWFGSDSSEPIGADVKLPAIPSKGFQIEVWESYAASGARQPDSREGEEHFLTVLETMLSSYAPERIVCQVSTEGFTRQDMVDIMAAIKRGDQP